MNYNQIFREQKTNKEGTGERADQFYALTLYECKDDYKAPFLLEVEWGNPQLDDWDRLWGIMRSPNRNQAIREVIKRLDNHVFLTCDSCACTIKDRCADCKDFDMHVFRDMPK